MTSPSPATVDREREKLWMTDAEIIRKLGVPEKIARDALLVLDADKRSGFPPKQKLWGDRRYFPAVQAWMERNYATFANRRG